MVAPFWDSFWSNHTPFLCSLNIWIEDAFEMNIEDRMSCIWNFQTTGSTSDLGRIEDQRHTTSVTSQDFVAANCTGGRTFERNTGRVIGSTVVRSTEGSGRTCTLGTGTVVPTHISTVVSGRT